MAIGCCGDDDSRADGDRGDHPHCRSRIHPESIGHHVGTVDHDRRANTGWTFARRGAVEGTLDDRAVADAFHRVEVEEVGLAKREALVLEVEA